MHLLPFCTVVGNDWPFSVWEQSSAELEHCWVQGSLKKSLITLWRVTHHSLLSLCAGTFTGSFTDSHVFLDSTQHAFKKYLRIFMSPSLSNAFDWAALFSIYIMSFMLNHYSHVSFGPDVWELILYYTPNHLLFIPSICFVFYESSKLKLNVVFHRSPVEQTNE